MKGIMNFVNFIIENWATISFIVIFLIGVAKKVYNFFNKPKGKRIEAIKEVVKKSMLEYITNAECEYSEWSKAGEIKRSQVIKKIYEDYPILAKVADQDALEDWFDEQIDEGLETVREIVQKSFNEALNTNTETEIDTTL